MSQIDGKNKKIKISLSYVILIVLLAASVLVSLLFGAESLSLREILAKDGNRFSKIIFMQIRLPRTILALLTGALLAGSGAVFQMYFRNPLAEPGIMGISSGATLGAVIVSTLFMGTVLSNDITNAVNTTVRSAFMGTVSPVNIGAFLGALAAGLLVTVISNKKTGASATVALLLCGTALGTFYSSLTSILLTAKSESLHTMYMWMLGSFSGRGWDEFILILVPSVISIILMFVSCRKLDLLSGGEMTALSLGVEVGRLRMLVIIAGSLATSAAVCAGGTIGFVGLIAPHVVRRIFGAKGKTLLPVSMVCGSVLLLFADTVSRVVVRPAEIPVGTITALLGAPFFIMLIFSKRGLKNG